MLKKLIDRIKRVFSCEYWLIAYGRDGNIDQVISEKYISLADPFLFYHRGQNWLFCERQDLTDMKGNLWCINLDDPEAEPICILDEPFHLSYPQVFEYGKHIYMIPESRQAGEVRLYRCVNFPDQWVCEDVVLPFPAVDTTIYISGRKLDRAKTRREHIESKEGEVSDYPQGLIFTYVDKHLEIYRITLEKEEFDIREMELLYSGEDDKKVRPAGRISAVGDTVVRPAQFCEIFYGEKLLFYRLGGEEEELIDEMKPEDFDYLPIHPIGIHTYNENDDYTVVDILHRQTGLGVIFKKIQWKNYNRKHKIK